MTNADVSDTPNQPDPIDWGKVIVTAAMIFLAISITLAIVSGARTWGTGYR